MTDPIVGRILCQEGVEQAIALRRGEDHEAEWTLDRELPGSEDHDEEDVLSYFALSLEHDGRNWEQGTKCHVDWTKALKGIARKWRRGGDPT